MPPPRPPPLLPQALPAPLAPLLEACGAGLCLLDASWKVIHANQVWLGFAGASLEEAAGRGVWELFPDLPAELRGMVDRPLPTAPVQLPPYRRALAGREAWYAGQLAPLELEAGPALLVTVVDVTAQERTSARLREALAAADQKAAELDGILQAIPHAVYFGDEGGITRCNAEALRMLGASSVEDLRARIGELGARFRVRHRQDGGLVAPQDLPFVRALGGEVASLDTWVTQADTGRDALVRGNSAPVRLGGRIIGAVAVNIDITDHHRLRSQWQLALSAAAMGWWRYDPERRAVAFDERFGRLIGAAEGELTAEAVLGLVHPEDVPRVREAFRTAVTLAAVDPQGIEFRIRVGEEVRWIEAHGAAILDGEGPARRVAGYVGTAADVTGRRRAEEQLRQEERKYRALFENSADAVYVTRHDGEVLDANRAACRLHGLTVDEIRRRGWAGLVAQDERLVDALRQRGADGAVRTELHLLRQDGSQVLAEVDSVVVDAGREDWTSFVIARDVSGRRRAEEELGRLAAAVEQTPISIVITDAAGVIQYVNPAFERITGWGRAEVLGRRPGLLRSGSHGEAFYRELWRTISSGQVWRGRFVNRTKDGRLFTEDASIAPVLDARGEIRNYVAVKRDVTEELARQESLSQTQRLETVGRLAGGVAHDFNNLLTVIQSCGESLRRATGRGQPVAGDDVEQINQAAGRASELTRQLLAFARRQPMAPEPLDLNRILAEAMRMLERLLGEDVELQLSLFQQLWPVRSDPALLDQLLLNLVANARDALPRGGRVLIATGNLEVAAGSRAWPRLRPGEYVRLEVRDDGVGMAADVLEHAFEPFYTTKGVGRGTGLGLATVHGIVTQSGGGIRVESEPGVGTRVVVVLPRSERPADAPATQAEAAPEVGGQETILLAEDEPAVRKQVLRALAGAGYQVHLAGDGNEALELAASLERPPDLLLTDVIMPRMDGARLAEALQARWPGLPVLFMSGYTDERLESTGVLGGPWGLLEKPFTGSSLLRRVREVLDRGRVSKVGHD
jgi:two-component system, cell cycle sensor histidine kinase and response regulator CckA